MFTLKFSNLTKKEKLQVKKYRDRMMHHLQKDDPNLYQMLVPVFNTRKFSQAKHDFSIVLAKMYVQSLRYNIKKSLHYKHEHGIWTNKAPIGYKNYRDKKGQAQIKVDPNMAYKIRQLFKVRAYGLSLSQLEKYMATLPDIRGQKAKPYIFKKQQISRILHNSFYTGSMIIKGNAYPHNYPKIVSKELFDEVQRTFKQ